MKMTKYCSRTFLVLIVTFCLSAMVSFSGEKRAFSLTQDLSIGTENGDDNLIFGSVASIGLDGAQNIDILDGSSQSRIQVFDPKGAFLRSIPLRQGQGPAEASELAGVAVGPSGTIYVLDSGGSKVMLFDKNGTFLRQFKINFEPRDIGLLPGEQVVLLGLSRGALIHVYDKEGRPLASYGEPFEVPSNLSAYKDVPQLKCPLRFSVGLDGRVFVFNPHRFQVLIYRNAKFETKVEGKSDLFVPAQVAHANSESIGMVFPFLTIFGTGDRLYVTVQRSPLKKEKGQNEMIIYEKGERVGSLGLSGQPMAIDAQGRLYCSEETDFPRVVRYIVKEK